jgi:hypothetical protein
MAGNWETPGHSLRSGLGATDEVEEFKAERTEEVVIRAAAFTRSCIYTWLAKARRVFRPATTEIGCPPVTVL